MRSLYVLKAYDTLESGLNQHICKCENRVRTVKCSRTFSKRGAYTESNNAPARNRFWPCETSSIRAVYVSFIVFCVGKIKG